MTGLSDAGCTFRSESQPFRARLSANGTEVKARSGLSEGISKTPVHLQPLSFFGRGLRAAAFIFHISDNKSPAVTQHLQYSFYFFHYP